MQIDLGGKRVLITGGAAGIGRACAELLGECGARVAVCDLNLEGARETVAALPGGLALYCDLADPEGITHMAGEVLDAFGGLDILVNNAGIISFRRGVGGVTAEEWDGLMAVNLRGPFLVCQAFAEALKAQPGGKVVNFSSMSARVGGIEVGLHYSTAKAGIIGMTRTLAKEFGPYGVNVNTVVPGFTRTEPVKGQLAGRESAYDSQIPLGRLAEPMDVAKVVLFLVSPLSDYLTGLAIDVNGGMFMG
ncbi:MAG: SDR family NAD(P)-dependent oxidoreductase [Anaerolineae bacterium]